LLTRFGSAFPDELSEQAILPTAETISRNRLRVFFMPVSTPTRSVEGSSPPHSVDDAGDELAAIGESVAPLLKFFDERAIKVRTGTARDYAPIAQRLAPWLEVASFGDRVRLNLMQRCPDSRTNRMQ